MSYIIVWGIIIFLSGCQSAHYSAWETLGREKGHLLYNQLENTRDDLKKASREFKDALSRLQELYDFDDGNLEKFYKRISDDYRKCADRANLVDDRIGKVQIIAEDFFAEWRDESDQIQNSDLRSKSTGKLKATQLRYAFMENALLTTRARMTPILNHLRDYVLFLKHNFNTQAIGLLKDKVSGIESEVNLLIRDTRQSIESIDEFLQTFEK